MKQKKEKISRVLALILLLAFAGAPEFMLQREANAQDRTINVNERLDLRALGIDNEARKLISLMGVHARFFKRGAELKQKSTLLPRDASSFFDEADARKSDLQTIKRDLESLIGKLKQGNHWNEAFDAQFLASLKNASARSSLVQAGGARKLFESALGEVGPLRQEIEEEVRQVNIKKTSGLRNRRDQVFAAHARPPLGKAGCGLLHVAFLYVDFYGPESTACEIAKRSNDKGCNPRLACDGITLLGRLSNADALPVN